MVFVFDEYEHEFTREAIKNTFGNRRNWEKYKSVHRVIWLKCYLESFNYCRTC